MPVTTPRRRALPLGTAALATVLLTLLTAAPVSPAAAAPANHLDGLEFSRDGMTWSPQPPEVLFEDGFVDTPGEHRSAVVLVRNTRASTVRIATALAGLAWSDPAAATAFTLTSSDQYGKGIVDAPIGSIARCAALIPTRIIGAGDILAIAVTVRFDAAARGTSAESASVRFDLLIALGPYPGLSPASACSDLAHTENSFAPDADLGIVVIASLPHELAPGTVHDTDADVALVVPTLGVALGAGIAFYLLVLLRRRLAADTDDLEAALERESAS